MTPKKILLLTNVLLVGLVLWMGFNIYRTWILYRNMQNRPISANLEAKKNGGPDLKKAYKRKNYKIIISRDIFKTKPHLLKPSPKIVPKRTKPIVKRENIDLELMGTVVGDKGDSFAIIMEKSKRYQEIYALYDFIGDARIVQILTDRVVLEGNGSQEILEMSYERGVMRRGKVPTAKLMKNKLPAGIQRKIVPRKPIQPRKRPTRAPVMPPSLEPEARRR